MVKLDLKFKAELSNLTDLRPNQPDDYQFFFKIKCSSCHEVHQSWVDICRSKEYQLPRSRGVANFVWKCQFCKRDASASFVDQIQNSKSKSSYPMYTDSDSSNQSFVSICTIECRGCELIEFEPRGLWDCTGSDSKTEFKEIEFEDGEWHDYDEKSGLPVSVTNIETRVERA